MSPKEQAQQLLFQAWEEPSSRKKMQLANQALNIYPNSPDAYNILAETTAHSDTEALALYKKAIIIGEKDLGSSFIKENKGHFWGLTETRPYMRAKYSYAEICLQSHRVDEAIKHFEDMLALNPNDNQGARYFLLTVYIQNRSYSKVAELIKQYEKEGSAHFLFAKVMVEYGLNGLSSRLPALFKKAYKHNPYVLRYLSGKKKLPNKLPEYIGYGDDNEAVEYVMRNSAIWGDHLPLLQWMIDNA
jgi:tetratricopeptide (TPR) repeat protein